MEGNDLGKVEKNEKIERERENNDKKEKVMTWYSQFPFDGIEIALWFSYLINKYKININFDINIFSLYQNNFNN